MMENADERPKQDETSSAEPNEMYGCEIICCNYNSKRKPIPCMQKINNSKGAVVFLCIALFLEGLINAGLFNAVISTIERRFQIQSTESGLVASGFDMFSCVALLVIAFSGDRAFKPHWLGWGTFFMGVGSVLYAVPHFTAPVYSFSTSHNGSLCGQNTANVVCSGSRIRDYRYLFFFANGLIGLGSTPLFTIAITYIDENVKQKNSALYGGIYYSMGAIGPAAGYLVGSGLLSTYTYIGVPVSITPTSSVWIGNWWIGFLVSGVICIVLSIFISLFPKSLPGTTRFRQNRNSEIHRNRASVKAAQNERFGKSWKDAPKVLWLLVTNIPYVSLTLSSCINYSFVYGFNTFGAKYISSVFGITISLASLSFGIAAILGAAIGQFLGGWAITKYKLSVEGILKFMIWCTVVSILATIGFLMHCRNTTFIGPGLDAMNAWTAPGCSSSCTCSSDVFEPICGIDSKSYFSPCYAGCSNRVNSTHFTNCLCLSGSAPNMSSLAGSGSGQIPLVADADAASGECLANNCYWFGPFLVIVVIATLSTIMKTTPNLQATIRCIPFNLRTTAVSLQRLIFTLLGTIPGRIVTGKIIDMACISWGTECGVVGACRAYNTQQASKNMTILIISQMIFCLVLQVITLRIYKPPKMVNNEHSPTQDVTLENDLQDDRVNTIQLERTDETIKS